MRNLTDGRILTIDQFTTMVEATNQDVDSPDWEYTDISLSVSGNGYYLAGKTGGDPLDCYQGDSGVNIDYIIDNSDKDWLGLLTKQELDIINRELVQNCKNGGDC